MTTKDKALATELREQEPEQSKIFCGVDFADGLLFVSVLRRRADGVAELLHAEQIELPAPVAKPIPFVEFYKPAQSDIRNATLDEIALFIEDYVEGFDRDYRELGLELADEILSRKT